ncbi:hypothetical protein NMV_012 [Medusavirus stheno T3]|uniref:Uncharacterized protein n=1 Tax=Medusavirus stheno T3 TaxID=3069717 RepID=A0A7S7YEQ4_9VIRU|nr:hypothetical protein NMV_012 [Acanthamoeba castellanii medusavirus]QPB44433.1 hypothetical protein NMV_012 [Medusavirus stheno T3]
MEAQLVYGLHRLETLGGANRRSLYDQDTLALYTKEGLIFIPVRLRKGKIKYLICTKCGNNVAWHRGDCTCGNLQEDKEQSGRYTLRDEGLSFTHKTWEVKN